MKAITVIYDALWLRYDHRLDAPTVDMSYFNVGQLNESLPAPRRRIHASERELAARKAKEVRAKDGRE